MIKVYWNKSEAQKQVEKMHIVGWPKACVKKYNGGVSYSYAWP